jgi:hypothetical protein
LVQLYSTSIDVVVPHAVATTHGVAGLGRSNDPVRPASARAATTAYRAAKCAEAPRAYLIIMSRQVEITRTRVRAEIANVMPQKEGGGADGEGVQVWPSACVSVGCVCV